MSDEGYIAVKQNEDRNYGTVAMSEEEQGPSATEEAASITQVGATNLFLRVHLPSIPVAAKPVQY